jgi:hypothetical protein
MEYAAGRGVTDGRLFLAMKPRSREFYVLLLGPKKGQKARSKMDFNIILPLG